MACHPIFSTKKEIKRGSITDGVGVRGLDVCFECMLVQKRRRVAQKRTSYPFGAPGIVSPFPSTPPPQLEPRRGAPSCLQRKLNRSRKSHENECWLSYDRVLGRGGLRVLTAKYHLTPPLPREEESESGQFHIVPPSTRLIIEDNFPSQKFQCRYLFKLSLCREGG